MCVDCRKKAKPIRLYFLKKLKGCTGLVSELLIFLYFRSFSHLPLIGSGSRSKKCRISSISYCLHAKVVVAIRFQVQHDAPLLGLAPRQPAAVLADHQLARDNFAGKQWQS
jgi:hypothetical protein